MSFRPIETEEELNQIISEKIQETESKYTNYKSESEFNEIKEKLQKSEKKLMQFKIAQSHEIPVELAEKISGETEEDMKHDADRLAKFVTKKATPDFHGENAVNTKDEKFRSILTALKGE